MAGSEIKTNADMVRDISKILKNMSDEELATLLCSMTTAEACSGCIAREFCSGGHTGFLDWLKQECK